MMMGGGVTDWKYTWYKNGNSDSSTKKNKHEISDAKISDSGDYICLGTHIDEQHHSEWSDVVTLTVTALPKATLTAEPNPVYPEETVTLTCSVGSDSSWSYQWYKDRNDNVVSQSGRHTITGDTLTIRRVAKSDQGQFWCQGEIQSRSIKSIIGDPVRVTLNTLPTSSVKIVTPQGLVYTGETVTLQCDISDYTGWTYSWFRDNQELPIQTRKNYISLPDQAGQYNCFGTRRGRPQKSYLSSALPIIITALPKATLTVNPNPVFPGETVTLTCSTRSYSRWRYMWYKDRNYNVFSQSVRHTITGDTLTISSVAESDQGLYWCQGEIRSRSISSIISDPVTITLNALPKATLTVKPNPAYTGEKVTLTCSTESHSDWSYQWFKDRNDNVVSQSVRHTITGDTLIISRAGVSDQGQYWCEGNRVSRPTSSLTSDPVTLTVKDSRPTATLSLDQANVFTGDSVTLTCTVESYGWEFYWYRHRPDSTPRDLLLF
ncbi:neural cell adhesion molecule 1-like [Coregonus clupeaformis]|uniref:neural cell adhesion molecule 1-like n=1 Tax=Coregonus clupeaformis TaxID=59861 RepID=UPI001E1C5742|nr:neural cell adhesion molecule 1-like [Coregonus clupeaformis]